MRQLSGGAGASEQRWTPAAGRRGAPASFPPSLSPRKENETLFPPRACSAGEPFAPPQKRAAPQRDPPGREGGGERESSPGPAARQRRRRECPSAPSQTGTVLPRHTQGQPRLSFPRPVPKQKRRAGGGRPRRSCPAAAGDDGAAGGCGLPSARDAPPSRCQAAGGRAVPAREGRRGGGAPPASLRGCGLRPGWGGLSGGGDGAGGSWATWRAGQGAAAAGATGGGAEAPGGGAFPRPLPPPRAVSTTCGAGGAPACAVPGGARTARFAASETL